MIYDEALRAVERLRDLGAVSVRVGDIEVTFDRQPHGGQIEWPSFEPSTAEEDSDAAKAAWEALQYHSAGG